MARAYTGSRGVRTTRNRRLRRIVPLLVLTTLAIAFAYNSFTRNKPRTAAASTDTPIQTLTDTPIQTQTDTEPPSEMQATDSAASVEEPQAQQGPSEIEPLPTDEHDSGTVGPTAENPPALDLNDAEIIQTRNRLNAALQDPARIEHHRAVKERLGRLAEKWLFSRTVYPHDTLCTNYKVEPGDLLSTIGRKHKIPYQILLKINRISDPRTLRAGDTIKVINGPFNACINRSTFTLDLYLQDTFVRSFPVGLGRAGRETPTGLWRVKPDGKLVEPSWTDPETNRTYHASDPDYPLGSRWIGLEGLEGNAKQRTGFAIHGTKNTQSIEKAASRGCIRMYDNDAVLMYNLLIPALSQVRVTD